MTQMVLPTFVGIGAPKTATTWLFRCLDEHPDVFMAPCKETNFFDWDIIDGRLDEYGAHFRAAGEVRAIGEISVRYFASPWAPERMARVIPEARLVLSLRNPVDQVYSHYWHLRRQNFHRGDVQGVELSFEEALERYRDELLGPASYTLHLRRWLDHFDRSRLLVLLYEDIREQPREVLRQVYSFLGVEARFIPASLHENGAAARRGTSPRSRLHAKAYARLTDAVSRWFYQPLKRVVGTRRAILVKEALRVRELLELIFQRPGYPDLAPETRQGLREHFAGDVRQLESLIGRDLGQWT